MPRQLGIDELMAQLGRLKTENARLRELLTRVAQAANANNIRPEAEANLPLWMDAGTLREIAEAIKDG